MKRPKLTGTTMLLVGVGTSLLVLLVGWFVLVSPQRSKASDLDTQIQVAQTKLADGQHLLASTNVKKSETAFHVAQRTLPDTPEMSAILRQLAAAVASSRTQLDAITPAALVDTGNGAQALPMSVSVEGHYFALQKLLRLLNKSAGLKGASTITGEGRLYTVDGIQFSSTTASGASSSTTPSAGLIQATINLNAFVYGSAPVTTSTTTTTGSTDLSAASSTP
jgi:Tfp pilus assembly protein PilN